MKRSLKAVSFWYAQDDRTRINTGRVTDEQRGFKVRIPLKQWRESDLPNDVADWVVLATDTEGDHHHGEAYRTSRQPGSMHVWVASGAITYTSFP